MAKVFQQGDNIVLYVPLPDESTLGVPITTANYSIHDMNGDIVIDNAVLPIANIETDAFGSSLVVNVPPLPDDTTLPGVPGAPRAFFRVSLHLVADSGFVHNHIDEFYLEDIMTDLDPPSNAFSTYGFMMTIAGSRGDMDVFLNADFDVRMSALIQAFEDIRACPLVIKRTVDNVEGTYAIIPSLIDETITLTDEEKRVLSLAQVQQANYILGGYAAEDLRRIGIKQTVAGGNSTLYQSGKVLPIVVCNAAQNTLRPYFGWRVKLTRT